MGRNIWLCSIVMVLGVASIDSSALAAVEYSVSSLAPPGATASAAADINNAGQVAGRYTNGAGQTHAFRYTNGVFEDPGTLGGNFAEAYGINAQGQIVGRSDTEFDTGNFVHMFVSNGTSITDLNLYGAAFGINDAGKISGFTTAPGFQAMLYSGGTWTSLGTLGGSASRASRINNNGHVVGAAHTSAGQFRAFRYAGSGPLIDLGAGNSSAASDINDAGQIIGSKTDSFGNSSGFLYSGGTPSFIPLNNPYGINSAGVIVGVNVPFNHPEGRAAIYRNGSTTDLNNLIAADSGWVLSAAQAINDLGQIVGSGQFNGVQQAFLLTPLPEPGSIAVMAIIGMTATCRRRAKGRQGARATKVL